MTIIEVIKTKTAKFAAIAAICGGLYQLQPYRPVVFLGESMAPTYQSFEIVSSRPFTGTLKRGDIVVIKSPVGQIVKRVKYLPGDALDQVETGDGWTDLVDVKPNPSTAGHSVHFRTQVIPDGYIYVLGDNPTVSVDSRFFGPVKISQIQRVLTSPRPLDLRAGNDYVARR